MARRSRTTGQEAQVYARFRALTRRLGAISAAVLTAALSIACDSAEGPNATPTTVRRGDTTRVTSAATVPVLQIDSVDVVWASDSISFPVDLGVVGDRIVVGDRERLHFLTRSGEYVASIGRGGEGPGEFGGIAGLVGRNDTLFVFDERLNRLSFFDASGGFLGSKQQTPHADFHSVERPNLRFHLDGNAMTYAATPGMVQVDEPMDAAIVRREIGGDGAEIRGPWFWLEFRDAGSVLVAPRPLGPRARMSVGPGGVWAYGDGQDYCLQVGRFGHPEVTEICRIWERAPVSSEVANPDLDEIAERMDWNDRRKEAFESSIPLQEFDSEFPSFDRLWFAENGDLWVRTWDTDRAILHPDLEIEVELRAPLFSWDVFSGNGRLLRTLRMSSNFEPKLILEGEAWGLTTLPFGERAVARVRW